MTEHVVTLRPVPAWGDVEATCRCGWVGSYASERWARFGADRHLAATFLRDAHAVWQVMQVRSRDYVSRRAVETAAALALAFRARLEGEAGPSSRPPTRTPRPTGRR